MEVKMVCTEGMVETLWSVGRQHVKQLISTLLYNYLE